MQVDPVGRLFFINHNEKKTTFVDPRMGRPSELPVQYNVPNDCHKNDPGPLPEGWEERVNADGSIIFVNVSTRHTQSVDPRISNVTIAGSRSWIAGMSILWLIIVIFYFFFRNIWKTTKVISDLNSN